MHHIKKATIRDLRYDFSRIEDLRQEGEEILISKRRRVVARLSPAHPATPLRRRTARLGLRTLDILQLGSAVVLRAERLPSFDFRQVQLAQAEGFRTS